MKNQDGFGKLIIATLIFTALGVISVAAKTNDTINAALRIERYKSAIVQKLTEKLRVDLSDQTVEVRLAAVQNGEPSKNRIDFDGKAFAVVKADNSELPFQFSATVNAGSRNVETLDYKFVEESADFAPSMTEDVLMKELMGELSKDFKTTNIVIALDGFETAALAAGATKYEGTGEVRIGDVEWQRIDFKVVLDPDTKRAAKVTYNLQK